MTFNDKVSTAWSNLGRRKVRTVLTSIGIIVGIMTIVTMISLVNGVQMQVRTQFEKLGLDRVVVRPKTEGGLGGSMGGGGMGGFNPFGFGERTKLITPADVARWKTWPEAQKVIPEIEVPWSIITKLRWKGQTKPVRITSSTIRRGFFAEPPAKLAGTIELPEESGSIVLTRGILKNLTVAPAQYASLLGQTIEILLEAPRGEKQSYRFRVIGVSSEDTPSAQLSTLDRLAIKSWWYDEPNVLKSEGYDAVTLRAADVTQAKVLVGRLRREKLEVQSIDAILEAANRIFTVITAMLAMVSSVALLVACIGIVNTMIMSIYERTREI
ncbi:MAG: putative transport system permease protein, partial [Abditibacteriota bacterium]|nr:putative transport system permease protein [Abditibacteriota bacterium]